MEKHSYRIACLMLLFCFTLCFNGCGPGEDHALINSDEVVICAVLAHPDDETIIGGTLSMLTDKGFDITVVYVTSGDDGPDETGRGLYGDELGAVREEEAVEALKIIGIKNPPVFFRYPDGHINEYADSVKQKLDVLFDRLAPQIVIGFGPDGITGSLDHKSAGYAADLAFDLSVSGSLLLHVAITKPLPPFFAGGVAVPRNMVDQSVNVSRYAKLRTKVVEAHPTQFNSRTRSAYKILVHTMRKEKFTIAAKRNADELLDRCFNIETN